MSLLSKKRKPHILACQERHYVPGRIRIDCRALKYLTAVSRDLRDRLESLDGIAEVTFSHVTHNAVIVFDETHLGKAKVINALEHVVSAYSFSAFKGEREAEGQVVEERKLNKESFVSMFGTITGAAAGLLFQGLRRNSATLPVTGLNALKSPTALLSLGLSGPIFRSGAQSLAQHRRPNADTLSSAAILASLLSGRVTSALTVILLHEVAELLTAFTMNKTRKAISDMLSQGEDSVWRKLADGQLEKVPIADLKVDDHIVVHTGEKISVDGVVASGAASVDESAINGEFMPAVKNEASTVFAGTVVKDGTITIKSEKVGDDTAVARIIKMVEEAADHKAPIQNFADRFSSQLLFVNLILAGSVFTMTRNVARALSMLIIDYSCALRLSTVAAFSAAVNTAARNGVLIKGSNYIEAISEADTLVLDKTGTLTQGQPSVESVIPVNSKVSAKEVLQLAAAAEETSSHPLATAILNKILESGLSIPAHGEVKVTVGRGVETKVGRSIVRVGNKRFMNSFGIHTHPLREKAANLATEGQAIVYVSRGKNVIGLLGISDPLRDNMKKAINRLRYSGVDDIIMLTGDQEQQAEIVASRMLMDRYKSEQMPEDKANTVLKLQAEGVRVVMVGDGINDAAALAYSDVGIALGGTRTDIAMEAADITITGDSPMMLPAVYNLAEATMTTIKQNFIAAISVNSMGLLLSGMGLLPVLGGAILHNASTILVVGNSLRLLLHDMDSRP